MDGKSQPGSLLIAVGDAFQTRQVEICLFQITAKILKYGF
jgi:hypothetical protein